MSKTKLHTQPNFLARSNDLQIKDHYAADESNPPSLQTQPSLSMGANVIIANAMGDPNAMALVEAWRPRFTIKTVTSIEEVPWQ